MATCHVPGTASSDEAEGAGAVLEDFLEEGEKRLADQHQHAKPCSAESLRHPSKGRKPWKTGKETGGLTCVGSPRAGVSRRKATTGCHRPNRGWLVRPPASSLLLTSTHSSQGGGCPPSLELLQLAIYSCSLPGCGLAFPLSPEAPPRRTAHSRCSKGS